MKEDHPQGSHDGRIPPGPERRAPLRWLLDARSVAVFGASDRSSMHRVLLDNVRRGHGTRVLGINPNRKEVDGIPCVPAIRDAPDAVDVAVMAVGDERLEAAVGDALDAGVRCLVVPGLALSPGRRAVLDRIAAAVRGAGALMIGPDCMGVVVPDGPSPWLGTLPPSLRTEGAVGLVSHSGAVAEAVVATGDRLRLGLVASVGSEATFDVADACEHLAEDAGTRVVGLFLETVRRPLALHRALDRLAERDVPVVCLKTGRSAAAAAAARAHSGADVGNAEGFDAFARSTGLVVLPNLASFVETLALLQERRRPRGPRVAAVTNSGGEAQLLADEGEAAGLRFEPVSVDVADALQRLRPRSLPAVNPLDAWCSEAVDETFRAAFEIFAGSGDYDVLVGQVDQSPHLAGLEVENGLALTRALVEAADAHDLPAVVLSALPSEPMPEVAELAERCGAALLRTASSALLAIAAAGRRALHRRAGDERPPFTSGLSDLRVEQVRDDHYGPYVRVTAASGARAVALLPLREPVAATMLLDLATAGEPQALVERAGAGAYAP